MQQIKSNKVDFPLPEEPIIPVVLFFSMSSSILSNTKFSLVLLYLKLNLLILILVNLIGSL